MSIHGMGGPAGVIAASIPNHELLIIGNGTKQGLVKQVPSDIFYNCCVASEYSFGVENTILSRRCVNIPQANGVVIRCWQQVTIKVWIPRQTVTFLLVSSQTKKKENEKR